MTDLIEVRVSNLIGAPLDWAVAKATDASELSIGEQGIVCIYDTPEGGCWTNLYQPSTDWSQGGLLIDEHQGGLSHDLHLSGSPCGCSAGPLNSTWLSGPTALVAFCRSLVHAKLGPIVKVPKELLSCPD